MSDKNYKYEDDYDSDDSIEHEEIFNEMFETWFENIKKANCICKVIISLLFIIALPFILYYGMLLFYDSI